MDLAAVQALLPHSETNRRPSGQVTGLAYNSKTLKSGELFLCLRGIHADGHDYAAEAVQRGAAALVVERFLPLDILQIKVDDARQALLQLGRAFYGNPADKLGLVGVTGTNGKTTTTFYIRSVLQQLGKSVGLIGTVFNQLTGAPEPSSLTTPEPTDLLQLFARAVDEGCDWVVMEVSSHALSFRRVDPADFDVAVVTNITRDHFDYHQDYAHYWESKATLVRGLTPEVKTGRPKVAVLNADDPQVLKLAGETDARIVTYSLNGPADVYASDIVAGVTGSRFMLHLPGASPTPVRLPMPGIFNVSNGLAAAAVGWAAGVPLAGIAQGLEGCHSVPGRGEIIDEGQDFTVIVDFAHNPDALAKVVTLRPERQGGRTILLFGAEGGKDKGKRPEMGRAARGADYVIITSDNMRKEEPGEVARQIAEGVGDWPHEIILDRRRAIERAITMARPGDVVIIAGKGHEQTWIYGGERIPLDDRLFAREVLRASRAVR